MHAPLHPRQRITTSGPKNPRERLRLRILLDSFAAWRQRLDFFEIRPFDRRQVWKCRWPGDERYTDTDLLPYIQAGRYTDSLIAAFPIQAHECAVVKICTAKNLHS
jgi:hypothetical protein